MPPVLHTYLLVAFLAMQLIRGDAALRPPESRKRYHELSGRNSHASSGALWECNRPPPWVRARSSCMSMHLCVCWCVPLRVRRASAGACLCACARMRVGALCRHMRLQVKVTTSDKGDRLYELEPAAKLGSQRGSKNACDCLPKEMWGKQYEPVASAMLTVVHVVPHSPACIHPARYPAYRRTCSPAHRRAHHRCTPSLRTIAAHIAAHHHCAPSIPTCSRPILPVRAPFPISAG